MRVAEWLAKYTPAQSDAVPFRPLVDYIGETRYLSLAEVDDNRLVRARAEYKAEHVARPVLVDPGLGELIDERFVRHQLATVIPQGEMLGDLEVQQAAVRRVETDFMRARDIRVFEAIGDYEDPRGPTHVWRAAYTSIHPHRPPFAEHEQVSAKMIDASGKFVNALGERQPATYRGDRPRVFVSNVDGGIAIECAPKHIADLGAAPPSKLDSFSIIRYHHPAAGSDGILRYRVGNLIFIEAWEFLVRWDGEVLG